MIRKAAPIFLFVAIVIVSGCVSEGPTGTFIGGTKGLELQFQNLPSIIGPGVNFPISIYVQNVGEANIGAGDAIFTLNNADNFNINDPKITYDEPLAASKKIGDSILQGGVDYVTWSPASFTGKVLTEEQKIPIAVSACYNYSSSAIALACIARSDKTCAPNEEKPIQSSGAPIQLTKFSQYTLPQQGSNDIWLYYTIAVENKGDGAVFPMDQSCPSPSPNRQDMVSITSMRLGSQAINVKSACGDTIISMYQGKGSISCKVAVPTTDDFAEQLIVNLAYKYKQTVTAQIATIPR